LLFVVSFLLRVARGANVVETAIFIELVGRAIAMSFDVHETGLRLQVFAIIALVHIHWLPNT
jgi:hypothetical protein